jgi:L-lactate dehydrogenase (cytochrome)
LKGIQCGEDAILAYKHGVQGIVVSNHGGRQLDFGRSGIEILPEVMTALRSIGAEKKLEVYVDGGIRRGTGTYTQLQL